MDAKENTLFGKSLEELKALAVSLGLKAYVGRQLAEWMYRRHVHSYEEMTNISLKTRALLAERYPLGLTTPSRADTSKDGTKKYLYRTASGEYIESVYIPDRDRATLCISSQAGCRMGCKFCATGRLGLHASLSAAEILNQIESLPERDSLTNVVLMGMGEPFDNIEAVLKALETMTAEWGYAWSPTRITVSTAGVAKELDRFMHSTQVNLAISLHNPFGDERKEIMPIEKAYPIENIVKQLHNYDFSHQRRLSFEYILLNGINDSARHIARLCSLLNGLNCRINIIRFHKIPGSPYFSPADNMVEKFRDTLTSKGITTTIRASRGEDIQAACGLLSASAQKESNRH